MIDILLLTVRQAVSRSDYIVNRMFELNILSFSQAFRSKAGAMFSVYDSNAMNN